MNVAPLDFMEPATRSNVLPHIYITLLLLQLLLLQMDPLLHNYVGAGTLEAPKTNHSPCFTLLGKHPNSPELVTIE